jgi:hypothetical protein
MKTPVFSHVLTFPLFLGLAIGLATPAFAQTTAVEPPLPGVISAAGNAQVEAVPDQATVRIGIIRQSGTAKDAQEQASGIGQAILKAIGTVGIPAERIQTSRLTISPVYAQTKAGNGENPRITGFSAANAITVTLDNLALIGPVVDAGLDNGANQLEGVQFQLKNDGPAREQALRLAVAEAKGKASAMAEALQVTLGPLIEVSESGISVVPLDERFAGVATLAARASTPTPISAGQLEITASVVVRYAIAGTATKR